MKLYRKYLFFASCFLFSLPVYAQVSNKDYNEFYLCDGLLSYDQFAGILGQMTNAAGIMSFPSNISGAAFLTYRHYFSETAALGITLGMDNQKGDLSYGKEGVNGNMGNNGYGPSGYYKREVYTGAVELLANYRAGNRVRAYAYLGAGYTSTKVTFNFFSNITDQGYFYGTPSSLFLKQNTTVDFSHLNFQVTPIGFSTGKDLTAFIEFGFGYKGMISGGVSYRFSKHKPNPPLSEHVNNESIDGMVVIPLNFPLDSSFKDLGEIKAKKIKDKIDNDFSIQLKNFTDIAKERNSNAFRIKEMLPPARHNVYDIRGEAYYAGNLEKLKTEIEAKRDDSFKSEKCAFLVVYCPEAYKKLPPVLLHINDTNKLLIDQGTTCFFKIKEEGEIVIATDYSRIILDTRFGNYYYVRLNSKPNRSSLTLVDQVQGEVENSFIGKDYFYNIESDILLSSKISQHERLEKPVATNSNKPVVFIPVNYEIDSSWKYLGNVNSGTPADEPDLSLGYQLNTIAGNAIEDSANIVKISRIKKLNDNNCYWLKGKEWYSKNTDQVKAAVERKFNGEFGDKNYAYIVVYRPDDLPPVLFSKKCSILINDSAESVISKHTKFIFRIPTQGNVKIALTKHRSINLIVRKGNAYYLKVKVLKKSRTIEQVENDYGEIESNTLSDVKIVDL